MTMQLEIVCGFDESYEGFNERWWDHRGRHYFDNAVFLTVRDSVDEIARIELDQEVDPGEYVGARRLAGPPLLEIQFIEVRADLRCRGLGSAIVEALANLYPDRRLVAFSEDADGFWSSLGWARHLHRSDQEPNPRYRPLYVQRGTSKACLSG